MSDKPLTLFQGVVAVVAVVVAAYVLHRLTHPEPAKTEPQPTVDGRTPERIAEDERKATRAQAEKQHPVPEPKWYSGGTLHSATVAEWRVATHANKLATAADFLSKFHESGRLKPKVSAQIKGVDDLRAPATELVIALDKALGDGTPPTTTVAEAATMVMALMGWL